MFSYSISQLLSNRIGSDIVIPIAAKINAASNFVSAHDIVFTSSQGTVHGICHHRLDAVEVTMSALAPSMNYLHGCLQPQLVVPGILVATLASQCKAATTMQVHGRYFSQKRMKFQIIVSGMGCAQSARPVLKTYRFTKAIVIDADAAAAFARPSQASLLASDCDDTSNDSFGSLRESVESFDAHVILSLASSILFLPVCFQSDQKERTTEVIPPSSID